MTAEPEVTELDPTEDVGPEHCEPSPSEVEAHPHAGDSPEACEWSIQDEIQDAYAPEQTLMVSSPVDGLPIPAQERSSLQLALAPDYSYAHVCIADDREYVELFREEVEERKIDTFNDGPLLTRGMFLGNGADRERLRYPRERVVRRWGQTFVALTAEEYQKLTQPEPEDDGEILEGYVHPDVVPTPSADEPVFIAVRPRRERCEFYKRQRFNHDGMSPEEKGGKITFANCTHPARRSLGGAAMSLRDQTCYACDYRSPPDPISIELELDRREEEHLKTPVELVPLFGLS